MVTCRGYWWLPETPDNAAYGVLEWDGREHPTLTLDGHIEPISFPIGFGGALDVRSVILGLTVEGDEVTCFECVGAGRTLSFGKGAGQDRFTIWKGALVGLHCPTESQALFNSYRLSLTHLASWVPWSGLTEQAEKGWGYTLAYKDPPETFEADLPGMKVKVSLGYTVSGPWRRREIAESVRFSIDYVQAIPPWEVQMLEGESLRKLVSLATAKSNAIEQLEVVTGVAGKRPKACRWLSRRLPGAGLADDSAREGRLHEHETIFTAADWPQSRRTSMLTAWSQLQDEYPLTLNVLVQDIEAPVAAVDTRLLVLARGIEALHRRKYPVPDADIAKLEKRLNQLKEALSSSLWRWVRGRLRYAYEPTFEARIGRLLEDVGSSVSALIPDKRFCAALASYRNTYTHEDPTGNRPRDNLSAYGLCVRAQFLLIAWVLVEMGFTEVEVKRFFERNSAYQQYARGAIG